MLLKLNVKKDEEQENQNLSNSQLLDQKYNLLNTADAFLTPEQLKMKRIQKMQKTAAILREEKKKAQSDAKEQLESLKRSCDRNKFLRGLYQKRLEILEKMNEWAKKKEEFSKRGTQQAQQRMQKIVELGKEERQAPSVQVKVNKDTTDDDFGLKDQDWEVYRDIQRDGFSEEEEDGQQALNEVEEQICELDEDFNLLLYETGPGGYKPATAEDFQIRLWTDRYRGSEILFQPSIIGLDCAGISEALRNMFSQLPRDKVARLMSKVVILGGNTLVPGFEARIRSELEMAINEGMRLNIVNTYQPDKMVQPWLGAARLVNTWQQAGTMEQFTISRAAYQEMGSEYLQEHFLSNTKY